MDYVVSDSARTTAIKSLVAGRWRLTDGAVETLNRTYLDTFDWSIYLAGAALEWRDAPRPALIWSRLDGTEETLLQTEASPAFATDLPAGPFRTRLLELADSRRLLPIMGIHTRIRNLSLRNVDDKTVGRLTIEESRFLDPRTGRSGDLASRLRILPVRGYEAETEAAVDALHQELAIRPAQSPLLLEALAAAGRRPADYSSKLDYSLDPRARADLVTKTILRGLLATLEANLDGARANLDAEFLHDLRVATRRTRSALGQIRGVFPDAQVTRFKKAFAWLQLVTGPVRDLDVYLLDFDSNQQGLPASLRPHLEPLRAFLLTRQTAEQRRLARTLGGRRFTRLLADWRAFLDEAAPSPAKAPNGACPIKDLADRRIWALAKRVRREGRLIRPASPPEELHELRKSCKKLRYLIEFFQSLYPKEQSRALIALMKTLLDHLGGLQDLSIQAGHLHDLAQRMRDAKQADTETLLAMGALIGELFERRERAREAFDPAFSEFLSEETQSTMRALFRPARS